jgi:hypothetical protein
MCCVLISKETRSESRHIIVYIVDRFTNQYISGGSQVLTHTQLQTSQSCSYIKEMRRSQRAPQNKYILTHPLFPPRKIYSKTHRPCSDIVSASRCTQAYFLESHVAWKTTFPKRFLISQSAFGLLNYAHLLSSSFFSSPNNAP